VTVLCLLVAAVLIAPLRFGAPALVIPSPSAGESPRAAAIRQLRLLGDPSLDSIVTAMEARDYRLRRRAPGTLDAPAALGPLALATYDRDPEIRRVAIWGLGEMRYPTSLPVILPRLEDESPAVRAEACQALADIPFVPVTTQLVLRLGDRDAAVRGAAAHALGDRRDPLARQALEARLSDSDSSVRAIARWAIEQL
jgi:HEAT repeat protein